MGKTKATHVYIDTSAFLAILLGEADSRRLLKLLGKRKICTSSLLFLESERKLKFGLSFFERNKESCRRLLVSFVVFFNCRTITASAL